MFSLQADELVDEDFGVRDGQRGAVARHASIPMAPGVEVAPNAIGLAPLVLALIVDANVILDNRAELGQEAALPDGILVVDVTDDAFA